MNEPAFSIAWRVDAGVRRIVCDAADGEPLLLDCWPGGGVPLVDVVAEPDWQRRAPPWARPLRDRIIERLRGAGALVGEVRHDADGVRTTCIAAPDGSLSVECLHQPDDRTLPWERTRIVARDGRELAYLHLHAVSGPPLFPRAGIVELSLRGRFGDSHRLTIDAPADVFRLDDAEPAPLAALAGRLEPKRTPPPPAAPDPRGRHRELVMGVLGALFALAGLWVAVAARLPQDRLAGLAGVALGGYSAWEAVTTWRRRR